MATLVLSSLIGGAGGQFFGPIGRFLGTEAGIFLGSQIDRLVLGIGDTQRDIYGPRITGVRFPSVQERSIPIAYGKVKVTGTIIWHSPVKEISVTDQSTQSLSKGGPRIITNSTTFEYYISIAVAICQGPIDDVLNIWIDDVLVDKTQLHYRLYKGTETQEPDFLLEANGKSPAYRGIAYIVMQDLPLEDYNRRVPHFSFEVQKILNDQVNHKIKSVVMIPGSGEFVYDTEVQTKAPAIRAGDQLFPTGKERYINQNTNYNQADALVALEQLGACLPNLRWVSVVVNWFASSDDIADAEIYPAVEYKGDVINAPDGWQVAAWDRKSARQITLDSEGNPIYGGTPSDNSLRRYLRALKAKNYKVCLYPMLLIDVETKSWRGYVSGKPEHLVDFFNQYNRFIIHYASTFKDSIDAIIIGSEFRGLTAIKHQGEYPAVDHLVALASKVKEEVGERIVVTYAADWSEYHSSNGYFNLDKLWASPNIDVVGIDAYFPLTDEPQPARGFATDAIIAGWESGEGFNYFYEEGAPNTKVTFNDPKYSWKNIRYWWEHEHSNPDGVKTEWQPKMKPIWFTEYGFPSVNGCTNQPNVFVDSTSDAGRFPKYSDGSVDFKAQVTAINATLIKWQNSDMVSEMFLWAWDARPFPFFPARADIWKDYQAWQTGHWVQGKISYNQLGSIISDLLSKAGLNPSEFTTTQLNEPVSGYLILEQQSVKHTLEVLQQAYFFDFTERGDKVILVPRQDRNRIIINPQDVIGDFETKRVESLRLPSKIRLQYIDRLDNYQVGSTYAALNNPSANLGTVTMANEQTLRLPLVLSHNEAKAIADTHLYYLWHSRNLLKIDLPLKYSQVEPNDLIKFSNYLLRVIRIRRGSHISIEALQENPSLYSSSGSAPITVNFGGTEEYRHPGKTMFYALDLPLGDVENCIYIAAYSPGKYWQGAEFQISNDGGQNYSFVANTYSSATVGKTLEALGEGPLSVFDRSNVLKVAIQSGTLESIDELSLLNGNNLAVVGEEVIQFQNAELIGPSQYKLSKLIRGKIGTEHQISSHALGERFILLNQAICAIPYPKALLGTQRRLRACSIASNNQPTDLDFFYHGNNLKPFSVTHVDCTKNQQGDLKITWVRRARINGEWRDNADVPLEERQELYQVEIYEHIHGQNLHARTFTTAETQLVYDHATQTEDLRPNSSANLTVIIYQMSDYVGKGYPTVLEVTT